MVNKNYSKLWAAVTTIGPDLVGLHAKEIGLHLLRSGAVMAMYLNQIPVFTIMLVGCWSSDAFLHYIRKQVQEFSKGVSQVMVTNDNFFTIPEPLDEVPRILGHCLKLQCCNNSGCDALSAEMMPGFGLFH